MYYYFIWNIPLTDPNELRKPLQNSSFVDPKRISSPLNPNSSGNYPVDQQWLGVLFSTLQSVL